MLHGTRNRESHDSFIARAFAKSILTNFIYKETPLNEYGGGGGGGRGGGGGGGVEGATTRGLRLLRP